MQKAGDRWSQPIRQEGSGCGKPKVVCLFGVHLFVKKRQEESMEKITYSMQS